MTAKSATKSNNSNKYGQKWKKEKFHDLELPSENVAQVRRPGVQGLIKAGVLESMDVLTALVQQVTLPKAEGKVVVDESKIMEDKDTVLKMIDILDDIVLYVVNRPKVLDKYWCYQADDPEAPYYDIAKQGERVYFHEPTGEPLPKSAGGVPKKIPDHKRVQDDESDDNDPVIYVDDVDIEDKMFIMNYVVGGSRDLASFRSATEEAMGGLLDGKADKQIAE